MAAFGKRSRSKLDTCHEDIQMVMDECIKYYDFSVLEGHRTEEVQDDYNARGLSKLKWPKSKHNKKPSLGIDIAPYPIDWNDIERFRSLVFFIKGYAMAMGIEMRLGIDWNDNLKADQSFVDGPHLELVRHLVNDEWIDY